MKQTSIGALVALLCVAVSHASSPTIRLVTNGDFETGRLAPWTQTIDRGGPLDWTVTTEDAYSGDFSAHVRGNKMLFQAIDPVAGRDVTNVTFALKNSDATFNAYRFYYSGGSWDEHYVDSLDFDWHVYEVADKIDRTKTLAGIGIFGVLGGDRFETFLDEVSIGIVPEPATLFAVGALLAAASRRRN